MTPELSEFAARLRELIRFCFHEHAEAWTPAVGVQPSGCIGNALDPLQFNSQARELFALQFANNAPYRRFCEARGVSPQTIEDWREIPAIPTAAFKELELSCLQVEERTTVFHSSGTTGQLPSRHFHSAESLELYEASAWQWFRAHVVSDFQLPTSNCQFAILTPPPTRAPHSSLVHMFEIVRRGFGMPSSQFFGRADLDGDWHLNLGEVTRTLSESGDTDCPVMLLGTAFSFVHLLDHLAELGLGFKLPSGSRVMETGGYKGRSRSLSKAELHALIARRLGIPPSHIVCEYGMSELSSQAYDRVVGSSSPAPRAPRLFRFPPWARAQIISPETGREVADGETGLIRVFDLANVFSVMAIQTEDLGVRHADDFELLGRAAQSEPRGCSLMSVSSLNR